MAVPPLPPPPPGLLTPTQLASYARDGYLLLPGWLRADDMAAMRACAEGVVARFDASRLSVFSTDEQTRTSDEYFLSSGDQVRCFLEESALGRDGALLRPAAECVNKLGHALHTQLPPFRAASFDRRVAGVCASLGLVDPRVCQSMYILKSARVGGEVKPHVDGAFLYTVPQTCVGFWWPLADCTTRNGCLWAVPGSHARPVARRFRRAAGGGGGTEFAPLEPHAWDLSGAVPLEVAAGTLVLLHAALVHFSEANHSDVSRHAYSIHVVEGGGAGVVYPADNWLQIPGGPGAFPSLYEAGGGDALVAPPRSS